MTASFFLVFCRAALLLILSAVITIKTYGQTDTLKSIVNRLAQYQAQTVPEKIYLHLDRPLYLSGETAWFKLYYVDGAFHKPINFSKVVYVEVIGPDQTPVLQTKIALNQGRGNGSLVIPYAISSGNYVIRAYTHYMKNFSPDIYFQKSFTIVNTAAETIGTVEKSAPEYDINFFPEGGNLVTGLQSKVAFKITNKAGKGINYQGVVLDNTNKEVAQLKPTRFGMGHFVFTPVAGSNYRAVITLPNKKVLTQNILPAQEQGWVMRLDHTDVNQLKLIVNASESAAVGPIYLLSHARQIVTVAETGYFQQGQVTFLIDSKKLPEGISRLTLFNQQKKPVCERLYFKQPRLTAPIKAAFTKDTYATRDKVAVDIETQNQQTQPAPFNLSVAVYQLDSLAAAGKGDINSYFWLTSEVKGYIEDPDYYLKNTGPEVTTATDNLMLTQGWSRFSWQDILVKERSPLAHLPELGGHLITGKVIKSGTQTPVGGIPVYLTSPGNPIRVYTATSNQQGLIQFETNYFYGSKEIIVQSDTRQDSTSRIEVLSPFSEQAVTGFIPPFAWLKSWQPELTRRHLQNQVLQNYPQTNLRKYIYPIIDSAAFYGKPDESYLLDAYQRFQVMEEVLREYVRGVLVRKRRDNFYFRVLNTPYKSVFPNDPFVLLDGMPIFDLDKLMAFDPLKIKKIDVFTHLYVLGPQEHQGLVSLSTYQGDLGGFEPDSRALMTEYEGLQIQREFYAPRYETTAQKAVRLPDFRHLLYWSPEVNTNAQGKGSFDFYTSDQAGDYLVVIQGMSGQGESGSAVYQLKVIKSL